MISDKNVRTLPQILVIAKAILDAGKEKEFIAACAGQENYLVISTDSAREFIADFLQRNKINPAGVQVHTFSYGNDRCK